MSDLPEQQGGFFDPGSAALTAIFVSLGVGGLGYSKETETTLDAATKRLGSSLNRDLVVAREARTKAEDAERKAAVALRTMTTAKEAAETALATAESKILQLAELGAPAIAFQRADAATRTKANAKVVETLASHPTFGVLVATPDAKKAVETQLAYATSYQAKDRKSVV